MVQDLFDQMTSWCRQVLLNKPTITKLFMEFPYVMATECSQLLSLGAAAMCLLHPYCAE